MLFKNLTFFLFLRDRERKRERERERTSWGGAERGEDTKSEAGSRLRAVSPELNVGLEPTNGKIMT